MPLRDALDQQRGRHRPLVLRGSGGLSDFLALTGACADTLYEAFRQAGEPDGLARKLMLIAVLGADPRGHADGVQTLDLDARREIRDMAAELGVDADI